MFAATLCLYIQGNFLNIDYGLLDGKSINWSNYDTYAVLDSAALFAVLAVLFILWKKRKTLFSAIQVYASAFLSVVQIITLCTLLLTSGILAPAKEDPYYLSTKNLHAIGKEDNVVILILDAFDEQYLEEIFAAEPEKYKTIFQDFTHYTNVAAGGATTSSALPIILSGQHYPGNVSYNEYIANAFNSDGLYTELNEQGYSVNIYTEGYYVPYAAEKYVDNLITSAYTVNSPLGLTKKYSSLTLFKYVPHLIKRFFWLYTEDFNVYRVADDTNYGVYSSNDAEFYQILSTQGLKKIDEKTFSIIHTTGSHPPYNLNEYAQPAENVTILQKSRGQLYIVEEYLRQMKELGVYDSSTIIIMSDHGQENLPRGMMMIKQPYAAGYKENDAPISHFDLHHTFFELLGKETGESIFDIKEGADRVRMYYPQLNDNTSFYMAEHTIDGNPRDGSNVHSTGRTFAPEKKKIRYKLGEQLTFGADGTANYFVESGLNSIPPTYSWTDGNQTIFRFKLEKKPKKDLELLVEYYTVYLTINDQRLGIYVDDQLLFSETLTSEERRAIPVTIPASLAADKELVVRLDLPDAKRPSEYLGPGNDPRMLGLAMTGMSINLLDK